MLSAFANAFRTPDLRKKILFTLMILAVFRLGSIIPVPNVNVKQVDFCLKQATGRHPGPLLADQPVLRRRAAAPGGLRAGHHALHHREHHPAAADRGDPAARGAEEGRLSGQTKITQYTRYLTLVLAVLNSTAFVTLAVNDQLFTGCTGIVYNKSSSRSW